MTPSILLGLAILAYAFNRVSHRIRPASFQRLTWSQKLFGAVAVILVVLIVINPEFLAFGFLGDAAFVDLLVLLMSLQLQMVGTQARSCVSAVFSRITWWVMTPRMSYLLVVSAFAAIGSVISTIQKVMHRMSS